VMESAEDRRGDELGGAGEVRRLGVRQGMRIKKCPSRCAARETELFGGTRAMPEEKDS
jgi:hypothetical protein